MILRILPILFFLVVSMASSSQQGQTRVESHEIKDLILQINSIQKQRFAKLLHKAHEDHRIDSIQLSYFHKLMTDDFDESIWDLQKEKEKKNFDIAEDLQVEKILYNFLSQKYGSQSIFEGKEVLEEVKEQKTHPLVSKLTFLNVLYFGGGLLVIGSMTLFMTIAWESFGGVGIFLIATTYSFIFGLVGLGLWESEDTKIPGGILCSASIAMVPLAVYGLQKKFGFWMDDRPPHMRNEESFQDFRGWIRTKWIPMEIATAIVGFIYFRYIKFPFLLAPVSFCLWFMSMDLTPYLMKTYYFSWAQREKVSMFFGLGMLFFARLVEEKYGNVPDYAFWLYTFGLIAFDFGIYQLNTTNLSFNGIGISLLIFGRVFDRILFSIFGTISIMIFYRVQIQVLYRVYFEGAFRNPSQRLIQLRGEERFANHIIRNILLTILLSQVIANGYTLEFFFFIVGFLWMNLKYLFSFSSKPEIFHLANLLINIGYLFSLQYASINSLYIWWADIIICFNLMVFHVPVIIEFSLNKNTLLSSKIFYAYRFIICILLGFLNPLMKSEFFVFSVFVGAAMSFLSLYPVMNPNPRLHLKELWLHFFACLVAVVYTSFLESLYSYLLVCAGLSAIASLIFQLKDKNTWIMGLILVLSSPFLQSSLVSAIGGFLLYAYLSYLSYTIFKNSIAFPFFLTFLGLVVIGIGIQYQKNSDYIQELVDFKSSIFLVKITKSLIQYVTDSHSLVFKSIQSSKFTLPFSIPLCYSHIIVKMSLVEQRVAAASCIIFSLILVIDELIRKFLSGRPQITPAPLCANVNFHTAYLAQGYDGHGLVLEFRGQKPTDMEVSQVYLYVEGPIWDRLSSAIPQIFLSVAKNVVLPMKLCPTCMDPKAFAKGSTQFHMKVTLAATGPRVLHSTITSQLNSLASLGNCPPVTLVFKSRSGWFSKKTLFTTDLRVSEVVSLIEARSRQ